MVWAACAQFGEAVCVVGVDETLDGFVALHGGDETVRGADLTPQPWKYGEQSGLAAFLIQRLKFLTTES